MSFHFDAVSWPAVAASFVAGQIFLTLYFTVIFGKPWAEAYEPGKTPAEHTQDVPKYTYGIAAACTLALTVCVAVLQASLGAQGVADAALLGLVLSVGLVLGAMAPGYAFLKKLDAGRLAVGSQVTLTMLVSVILGAWPA